MGHSHHRRGCVHRRRATPPPSTTVSLASSSAGTSGIGGGLDAHSRYLFDLHGYLVIPDALSSAHVRELNAALDDQIAAQELPVRTSPSHRFGGLLGWGAAFRSLVDNPPVLPVLADLLGEDFRLDHTYLNVIRRGEGGTATSTGTTRLHGGGTVNGRWSDGGGSQFYHVHNGAIHNGLVVVHYELNGFREDDGGFGCIPGSVSRALPGSRLRHWYVAAHR